MVERGDDGDHADSDRDKADTDGNDESGRRVEPAPHIVIDIGRMHENSKAVALGTLHPPARK
jgi:hypothetical protein